MISSPLLLLKSCGSIIRVKGVTYLKRMVSMGILTIDSIGEGMTNVCHYRKNSKDGGGSACF